MRFLNKNTVYTVLHGKPESYVILAIVSTADEAERLVAEALAEPWSNNNVFSESWVVL